MASGTTYDTGDPDHLASNSHESRIGSASVSNLDIEGNLNLEIPDDASEGIAIGGKRKRPKRRGGKNKGKGNTDLQATSAASIEADEKEPFSFASTSAITTSSPQVQLSKMPSASSPTTFASFESLAETKPESSTSQMEMHSAPRPTLLDPAPSKIPVRTHDPNGIDKSMANGKASATVPNQIPISSYPGMQGFSEISSSSSLKFGESIKKSHPPSVHPTPLKQSQSSHHMATSEEVKPVPQVSTSTEDITRLMAENEAVHRELEIIKKTNKELQDVHDKDSVEIGRLQAITDRSETHFEDKAEIRAQLQAIHNECCKMNARIQKLEQPVSFMNVSDDHNAEEHLEHPEDPNDDGTEERTHPQNSDSEDKDSEGPFVTHNDESFGSYAEIFTMRKLDGICKKIINVEKKGYHRANDIFDTVLNNAEALHPLLKECYTPEERDARFQNTHYREYRKIMSNFPGSQHMLRDAYKEALKSENKFGPKVLLVEVPLRSEKSRSEPEESVVGEQLPSKDDGAELPQLDNPVDIEQFASDEDGAEFSQLDNPVDIEQLASDEDVAELSQLLVTTHIIKNNNAPECEQSVTEHSDIVDAEEAQTFTEGQRLSNSVQPSADLSSTEHYIISGSPSTWYARILSNGVGFAILIILATSLLACTSLYTHPGSYNSISSKWSPCEGPYFSKTAFCGNLNVPPNIPEMPRYLENTCTNDSTGVPDFPSVVIRLPESHKSEAPITFKAVVSKAYRKVATFGRSEASNTPLMRAFRLSVIGTAFVTEARSPIPDSSRAALLETFRYCAYGFALLGEMME